MVKPESHCREFTGDTGGGSREGLQALDTDVISFSSRCCVALDLEESRPRFTNRLFGLVWVKVQVIKAAWHSEVLSGLEKRK